MSRFMVIYILTMGREMENSKFKMQNYGGKGHPKRMPFSAFDYIFSQL